MEHQNPYQLKIKFKALSHEIRDIKHEEAKFLRFAKKLEKAQKAKDWYANSEKHRKDYADLREHRGVRLYDIKLPQKGLRPEARATHLARAFLKQMPYVQVESKRYLPPEWEKVQAMVLKYGLGDVRELKQTFERWMQEGESKVVDYRVSPKPARKKDVEVPTVAS